MSEKKKWFPTGGRFLSNLTLVLIGISFYWILDNLGPVRVWISGVISVLSPFLAGIALAYLLNSPTVFLERNVFHRFRYKRGLSILTAYLLAAVVVCFLLVLVLPQVAQSIISLVNNSNAYLSNFSSLVQRLITEFGLDGALLDDMMLSYQDIFSKVTNFLANQIPQILNYGIAIGNGLISGITALISSVYMLSGKERLLTQMRKLILATLPQESADWLLSVCKQANETFSGFISGKILDSVIIGLLCFFLCMLLRIPLAVLLGVVIGFTNIIPFFGPIVGAVPCVMVLLIVDPWASLRFLALILALQQFDGNILGPRILGNSTGLSAIWVLVAIVVGGGLFGFPGMLLGVPTFAVIYTLTREWVNRRLREKRITVNNPLPPTDEEDSEK